MGTIAKLLKKADDAGITLAFKEGRVFLTGNREDPVIEELKSNKDMILRHLEKVEYLVNKLIVGKKWLTKEHRTLWVSGDILDEKKWNRVIEHMHWWATLEEDLRSEGFEGCPVGECESTVIQPVRCSYCAETVKQEARWDDLHRSLEELKDK